VALGRAIPKLSAGAQDKARLALIERLESKTVNTLRGYLETGTERELRIAAVTAAGRKGKDEIAPDLIPLLKDKDRAVADAAYDALKSVSGKSFDKDPAAWEAWWKSKGSK
jgi:HEAT repeat protein